MDEEGQFAVQLAVVIGAALLGIFLLKRRERMMTPEQRAAEMWGGLNSVLICPHCQAGGNVRTKSVVQKKGVSGAKATGALLTGGVSLLATGLSRKEGATQAHCDRCNSTWHF